MSAPAREVITVLAAIFSNDAASSGRGLAAFVPFSVEIRNRRLYEGVHLRSNYLDRKEMTLA